MPLNLIRTHFLQDSLVGSQGICMLEMIHCARSRKWCCMPENYSRSETLKVLGSVIWATAWWIVNFQNPVLKLGRQFLGFLSSNILGFQNEFSFFGGYWIWNCIMSTGHASIPEVSAHPHMCAWLYVFPVKMLRISTICDGRNPGQLCFQICTCNLLNRHCYLSITDSENINWMLLQSKSYCFLCPINQEWLVL